MVSSAQIRPHVQRLLNSGVTADAITAQTGHWLLAKRIDNLLRRANFWIPVKTAEQILAMEVPPCA